MQLTLEESNLVEALSRYPDLIDDLKALNILENLVKRKRDPLVKTGSYPPAKIVDPTAEFKNKVNPVPDPWNGLDPWSVRYDQRQYLNSQKGETS